MYYIDERQTKIITKIK